MSLHIQHEAAEQEALFTWSAYQLGKFPELELMYAIPNGGSRNRLEAANLKRQGVKAGVPDICLPVARGKWHGIYIELKYGKNTTSDKQNQWIKKLRAQNYVAEVAYGWRQAAEMLTAYLETEVKE